ncbi:hypothetical protein Hanom_Chr03g00256761 [Helianthus anomalus]
MQPQTNLSRIEFSIKTVEVCRNLAGKVTGKSFFGRKLTRRAPLTTQGVLGAPRLENAPRRKKRALLTTMRIRI